MTLPNFLVIGAAKSGTTTLYDSLKQHPDVFLSPLKEPHFFSHGLSGNIEVAVERYGKYQSPITSLEIYQSLFENASNKTAIGEASTSYLIHPEAARRIKEYVPNVKLMAILRNPIDRAYSAFLMKCRIQQKDMADSQKLLDDFRGEVKAAYGENNTGLYCRKIQGYLDHFSRDQLKVLEFRDFQDNFSEIMKEVFIFLDIDSKVSVEKPKVRNKGGVPKNSLVFNSIERLRDRFNATVRPFIPDALSEQIYDLYTKTRNSTLEKPPSLPLEIKESLLGLYRDDILKLQDTLGQDFSMWLE